MTKSESNLFKTLLLNKRWETGSLNKYQRKQVINKLITKGYLTKSLQVTKKGHSEYIKTI